MIRKKSSNEISDDDFISEKQICQGTSKTILSVESVHVVKGIDKNIKKKIEEGKIYLNDISAVKNAEIEEAFLRSLHSSNVNNISKENFGKLETGSNSQEYYEEYFKRTNNEEDKHGKDNDYGVSYAKSNSNQKTRDISKREDMNEEKEMENNNIKGESNNVDSKSNSFIKRSTCNIYNNHDIQEMKKILKKETIKCIQKKKKKLEKKRLNADLEALRLQYIPINSDKFASFPREIKENILALFSCIIVKHIDSFDNDEVQNHLDDLSKKFLRQLADLLSIDPLAYQSVIKPFEQRKRIREMTGDKTFYELYEKPFIDNLLMKISELQPDIDLKFKTVVEELNNELDFWQNDELETVPEEESVENMDTKKNEEDGKSMGNDCTEKISDDMKNSDDMKSSDNMKNSDDMNGMNEMKSGDMKEKLDYFSNMSTKDNNKNEDSNTKTIPLEKIKSNAKMKLNMKTSNYYFSEEKRESGVSNVVEQENERNFSVDGESNSLFAGYDTDVSVIKQQISSSFENAKIGPNICESNEEVNLETKKENMKDTKIVRTSSSITLSSSKSDLEREEMHGEKKHDDDNESCYESDIEKHLNHGVPTKGPEAKSVLLRDLITMYIMTGSNNVRIQFYFQKFAKCLKINDLLISRIEENLAADLISTLQASINETSKKKKIRRIKIAFAALGGGALIAFTAGLAAPGIIAGLTALGAGGSSLTAFLASASGVAFIVSLFGAGGAGLTGYKYSRRIANIKTFEFIMLNGSVSKSLNVCVCISGEIKTDDDITRPWLEVFPNCYCDLYCLKWENHLLQTLGSLIETMLSQEFAVTASKIWLQHTIASALSASLTWPLALIKYASNLDNAYLLIRERAQQAGRILAEALSDKNTVGQRPVILIGYSMGARVIFYCLKYLYSKKLYNVVSNAIFIGLPATTSTRVWNNIRMVVTNRIVNVYSKNDWLLGFLYRYMEWKINVAGLMPIKAPYVENFDVSGIITSHLDYKSKLKDIFNLINFDM